MPSTYTQNLPMPSGISPNMLTTCMNDPKQPDRRCGGSVHNPQYSTFCYTFQYMPGATTYLDTPVVPVAAFAGPDQFPLDCELPDGTPKIYSVSATSNGVAGALRRAYADGAPAAADITSSGIDGSSRIPAMTVDERPRPSRATMVSAAADQAR